MILAEKKYKIQEVQNGYANRTLYLNISKNEISIKPVSDEMKEKYIG